ncbi:MAG: hypothetical protein M1823_004004 [Watsoniomyces obsoletus]|nr:MAG: hypothetical protein M1823_004004 [Watsoniomyces obsoletus]
MAPALHAQLGALAGNAKRVLASALLCDVCTSEQGSVLSVREQIQGSEMSHRHDGDAQFAGATYLHAGVASAK